jgi:hypothetical protein
MFSSLSLRLHPQLRGAARLLNIYSGDGPRRTATMRVVRLTLFFTGL